MSELPFVDAHSTDIAVGVDEVWSVLVDKADEAYSRGAAVWYVRVVGCEDRVAAGPRPLEVGSTVPGFRVASAVPGKELVLEGRHRFSTYALIFRLERLGVARTELTAETRATFPGVAGRIYRLLVIGTGGHVVGVRRLLADIKRRAEAADTGTPA